MKRLVHRTACSLALALSVGVMPVQQVLAGNPRAGGGGPPAAPGGTPVRDIALQAGGTLHGQVLDAQGQPCVHVPVRLVGTGARAETVVTVQTDKAGRFQFSNITGGVYRLETAQTAALCRAWAPNASPPSAEAGMLLVNGGAAVRGNLGGMGWLGWTLVGLGVAAAIAVPLALDDDAS